MRTISGKVRPFGTGTPGVYVRFEWPETVEEIEEVLEHRYEGDPLEGVIKDASRKALIRIQDYVRNDERWEEEDAPNEGDEAAIGDLQSTVNDMVAAAVLDLGTYPGETKSKKKDKLDEARQDEAAAQELIKELQARHGL